jgi:hypothetical protein
MALTAIAQTHKADALVDVAGSGPSKGYGQKKSSDIRNFGKDPLDLAGIAIGGRQRCPLDRFEGHHEFPAVDTGGELAVQQRKEVQPARKSRQTYQDRGPGMAQGCLQNAPVD